MATTAANLRPTRERVTALVANLEREELLVGHVTPFQRVLLKSSAIRKAVQPLVAAFERHAGKDGVLAAESVPAALSAVSLQPESGCDLRSLYASAEGGLDLRTFLLLTALAALERKLQPVLEETSPGAAEAAPSPVLAVLASPIVHSERSRHAAQLAAALAAGDEGMAADAAEELPLAAGVLNRAAPLEPSGATASSSLRSPPLPPGTAPAGAALPPAPSVHDALVAAASEAAAAVEWGEGGPSGAGPIAALSANEGLPAMSVSRSLSSRGLRSTAGGEGASEAPTARSCPLSALATEEALLMEGDTEAAAALAWASAQELHTTLAGYEQLTTMEAAAAGAGEVSPKAPLQGAVTGHQQLSVAPADAQVAGPGASPTRSAGSVRGSPVPASPSPSPALGPAAGMALPPPLPIPQADAPAGLTGLPWHPSAGARTPAGGAEGSRVTPRPILKGGGAGLTRRTTGPESTAAAEAGASPSAAELPAPGGAAGSLSPPCSQRHPRFAGVPSRDSKESAEATPRAEGSSARLHLAAVAPRWRNSGATSERSLGTPGDVLEEGGPTPSEEGPESSGGAPASEGEAPAARGVTITDPAAGSASLPLGGSTSARGTPSPGLAPASQRSAAGRAPAALRRTSTSPAMGGSAGGASPSTGAPFEGSPLPGRPISRGLSFRTLGLFINGHGGAAGKGAPRPLRGPGVELLAALHLVMEAYVQLDAGRRGELRQEDIARGLAELTLLSPSKSQPPHLREATLAAPLEPAEAGVLEAPGGAEAGSRGWGGPRFPVSTSPRFRPSRASRDAEGSEGPKRGAAAAGGGGPDLDASAAAFAAASESSPLDAVMAARLAELEREEDGSVSFPHFLVAFLMWLGAVDEDQLAPQPAPDTGAAAGAAGGGGAGGVAPTEISPAAALAVAEAARAAPTAAPGDTAARPLVPSTLPEHAEEAPLPDAPSEQEPVPAAPAADASSGGGIMGFFARLRRGSSS